MELEDAATTLFVCDAPDDVGVQILVNTFLRALGSPNALSSVSAAFDRHDKAVKGLIAIRVRSGVEASMLMRKPVTMIHRGQEYDLSITSSVETACSWLGIDAPLTTLAIWSSSISEAKNSPERSESKPEVETEGATPNTTSPESEASPTKEVEVLIRQGDITSSLCDAILNDTIDFDLIKSGEKSLEIVAKAGHHVAHQFATNPRTQTDHVRVTTGGTLWKYILHIATPTDTHLLERVLVQCFAEADRLGVYSLAIPPVGTDKIGLSNDQSVRCIAAALEQINKKTTLYLSRIEIYVGQTNSLQAFQKALSNKKDFREEMLLRQLMNPSKRSELSSTSAIPFVSMLKHPKKVDKSGFAKTLEDDAVEDLISDEEQEILSLMQEENLLIEKLSKRELRIKGPKVKVLSSIVKVTEIVNQLKVALPISHYVRWRYRSPKENEMEKFPVRASYVLENAHRKNRQGEIYVTVHDTTPNLHMAVDIWKMTARIGCVTYRIERVLKAETVIPDNWESTNDEASKLVEVSPTSLEYQRVVEKFSRTLVVNPVKLERIQNLTQWKQFQAQKRKVQQRMPNQTVARELFHGTEAETSEKIWSDTFDRSYAGKNATLYGKGVYFATTASYSNRYAKRDASGNQRMFLVEVVTGAYCKGCREIHVVPMQDDQTPYDSTVNDLADPTIFAVYRDASSYPLYLLTYRT